MDQTETTPDYTTLTADIVSAYVAKNAVTIADLPGVIASVHAALHGLSQPKTSEPVRPEPPVSIKKSITPDFLISLEDGQKYRSLKRHLTRHGLTPEQYRTKWGLPADYPMVAPNYSLQRSELARKLGLGQLRAKARDANLIVMAPETAPIVVSTETRQTKRKGKAPAVEAAPMIAAPKARAAKKTSDAEI